MPRAFLSHSSKDKPIVDGVFHELNASNCHYDANTFSAGLTSAENIFRSLSTTDLFVLFVSQNSVESPWVQTELSQAFSRIGAGKIAAILVFLLDSVSVDRLPKWVLHYTYRRQRKPKLIAIAIRSKLLEMDVESRQENDLFIGRDEELQGFKATLAKPSIESPRALVISGWEGIGRRTLVRRALRDLYPWLPTLFADIYLDDTQSSADLYRRLLEYAELLTPKQWAERLKAFEDLESGEKIDSLVKEVLNMASDNQVTFLRGNNSLIQDNGDLQEWLGKLLNKVPAGNQPVLVIITRRRVQFSKHGKYRHTFFATVNALSYENTKQLLSQLLKQYGLSYTSGFLEELAPYVSGHPRSIQLAADFAREFGTAALSVDKNEFRDLLTNRSVEILRKLRLELSHEKLLGIFGDYEYLSVEDVLPLFEPDENVEDALRYLRDHGVLEPEGRYYRLAPYLRDPVSRYAFPQQVIEFRRNVAKASYDRLKTLDIDEIASFSVIETGLLASIRRGAFESNEWWARIVYSSHILRIAREEYDKGNYKLSAELAEKAYSSGWSLTTEGKIEALRLFAMALARVPKDEEFYRALKEFGKYSQPFAKRSFHFVKGFKLRREGKPDLAEAELRKAYSYGGDQNFHILRELAQTLVSQERYSEAEVYARAAQNIAPQNVFVIDIVLSVLIGNETGKDSLRENKDIEELMEQLREESAASDRSFYENRAARYESKMGNHEEALKLANEAISKTPGIFNVYVTRAYVKYDAGQYRDMNEDIKELERISRDAKTGEGRIDRFQTTKIKVLYRASLGDLRGAKELLFKFSDFPVKVRSVLARELAEQVAYSSSADPELTKWANNVLRN